MVDDLDELLAFYDYPAEHWVHLRTTNPIESTFATVRHRTKVTKGRARVLPGSRWPSSLSSRRKSAGVRSTRSHLVALVHAGATFVQGKLVERPEESPAIEDQSIAA